MILVTIRNINIEAFISFFNDIDIKSKQVIDIYKTEDGKHEIVSRGHTITRDFVKVVESDFDVMCQEIVSKSDYSHIKIPFIEIRKFVELLKIYTDDEQVSINLSCDEKGESLVVVKLEVKSKRKSSRMPMADISLVPYLPKDIWENLLRSTERLSFFGLSQNDVTDVKKLMKYASESQASAKVKEISKFRVKFEDGQTTIMSYEDRWNIDIPTDGSFTGDFVFPAILFKHLSSTNVYDCAFVKAMGRDTKFLIVENKTLRTTCVVIAEKFDINKK
jgi:hypothetical protein